VKPLVVDANVFVSAADGTDRFSASSRSFLSAVVNAERTILVPALAHLEIACALARRLGNAEQGRRIARQLMDSPLISMHPLDRSLLDAALERGTASLLRAADACYAALAERMSGELVTWDVELIKRAGGASPESWMAQAGPG
jgi:predicted nucleic acid-binding protein